MGDGYRDELEAAHLRAARLEDDRRDLLERVDALEEALAAAPAPLPAATPAPKPKAAADPKASAAPLPAARKAARIASHVGVLVAGGVLATIALRWLDAPATPPPRVVPSEPVLTSALKSSPTTRIGAPILGLAAATAHPWVFGKRGIVSPGGDGRGERTTQDTGAGVDLLGGVVRDLQGENVVAVGRSGVIVTTKDGGKHWAPVSTGIALDLNAAAGTDELGVFAVGEHGTILHGDGDAWTAEESGTSEDLYAVAVDGDEVLAVGAAGTLVRRANGAWSRIDLPTHATLRAIFVNRHDDVFLGGDGGTLLMQDDRAVWMPVVWKMTENIRGLAGYAGRLLAATDRGNVWKLEPGEPESFVHVTDGELVGIANYGARLVAVGTNGACFNVALALGNASAARAP